MFDCESVPSSSLLSLYLDYGADSQACDEGEFKVSERGMRFRARWHFEIGTQLAVSCVLPKPRQMAKRLTLEGIVVWCEPCRDGGYESTVLFLELPDELKHSLREFSCQLASVP